LRIAPIANTEAQTVDKFSPYFVQVVPNTYMEAIAATRYLHKKVPKAKKFCTIGPDYEFGRREEAAFTQEIKRLVPDAEIVYEAWPKLGEKDFTAFITAIMAKKPDAVHGSLFGGDVVSFTKQAAPYGFFEKTPFIALYDFPVLLALGADAPEGTFGFGPHPAQEGKHSFPGEGNRGKTAVPHRPDGSRICPRYPAYLSGPDGPPEYPRGPQGKAGRHLEP
jgi:branched-chain amino acid transport system substrate-binding protein